MGLVSCEFVAFHQVQWTNSFRPSGGCIMQSSSLVASPSANSLPALQVPITDGLIRSAVVKDLDARSTPPSEVHSFHPSYAYPTEVCQHLIQIRNRTRDKSSWLVSVLYHVKTKWLPPTFASTRADTRHLFTFRSYLTEWISISGIHSSGRGVAPQQQQPTLP